MVDRGSRERPTGKESGSLGRWAVFQGWAMQLARELEAEVQKHTSVGSTNIRAAIMARRLRDQASLMALEFQGWSSVPTTSEERHAALARWDALQKRAESFLPSRREGSSK